MKLREGDKLICIFPALTTVGEITKIERDRIYLDNGIQSSKNLEALNSKAKLEIYSDERWDELTLDNRLKNNLTNLLESVRDLDLESKKRIFKVITRLNSKYL